MAVEALIMQGIDFTIISIDGEKDVQFVASDGVKPMVFHAVVSTARIDGQRKTLMQLSALSPEMEGVLPLQEGQYLGPLVVANDDGSYSVRYKHGERRIWQLAQEVQLANG